MYVAHTVCHAEIHKAIVDESQKPWNLSARQCQNKPLGVVGVYSTSDQLWSDQPLQSSEEWGLYNTTYSNFYFLMNSHSYILQSIHHVLKYHRKNTYITVCSVCIQNSMFIVKCHSKRYKVHTIINNSPILYLVTYNWNYSTICDIQIHHNRTMTKWSKHAAVWLQQK